MWSSDRRGLLLGALAAALLAAGCGFRPLHGEGSPAAALRGRIALGTIARAELPDRMSFTLSDALRRRLGDAPADAPFRLDIRLRVEERGLAVTPDNETTRFNLTARAEWSLVRRGAAGAALTGLAESYSAYSTTATVYATRIARRDAERRLAVDLADRIATDLAVRAGELRPA